MNERLEAAWRAWRSFYRDREQKQETTEESITDLVADLLLLADSILGKNMGNLIGGRAMSHYFVERED